MVATARASHSDVMNNGQCGKAGDRIEMDNDATIPTQQNAHHPKPHHGLFLLTCRYYSDLAYHCVLVVVN
jgi:hypothetical protein